MKHANHGTSLVLAPLLLGAVLGLFPSYRLPQAAGSQERNASLADKRDMALIKGGVLRMGIDSSQVPGLQKLFDVDAPQLFEAEIPRHSVTIDSFYIDKYLVTNAQFKRFVDQNPQWQPLRISKDLHNGNFLTHYAQGYSPDEADHPVVNVSWYAAAAYCRWAGKRLPTESRV